MDLTKKIGLEDFDIFRKSIEMIYGKNYFIDTTNKNYLYIHLYFDEITIKNSRNKSHIIKDLFVKISFYKNSMDQYELMSGLSGYRTFITQNEANIGYCHSHLSSGGNFCLGSGPLDKFMSKHAYSLLLKKEYIDTFDEMLLMIFQYVRWESLEGTPYKKLENIVKINSISKYQKVSNEFIASRNSVLNNRNISNQFLIRLFNLSKQIELKEGKYILKFDNELLLNLTLVPAERKLLYLYKGSDGNLYEEKETNRRRIADPIEVMGYCSLPKFPIKLESGKTIESLSTDISNIDEEIEFKKIVNKGFLTNIITAIEEKIKQKM